MFKWLLDRIGTTTERRRTFRVEWLDNHLIAYFNGMEPADIVNIAVKCRENGLNILVVDATLQIITFGDTERDPAGLHTEVARIAAPYLTYKD